LTKTETKLYLKVHNSINISELSLYRKALNPVPEKDLEVNSSEFFPADLSFPKRPPWDFKMTPLQLETQEQRYFKVNH
jgi:hypothetical protein